MLNNFWWCNVFEIKTSYYGIKILKKSKWIHQQSKSKNTRKVAHQNCFNIKEVAGMHEENITISTLQPYFRYLLVSF